MITESVECASYDMWIILISFKFFRGHPPDGLIIFLISYRLVDLLIINIFLLYICKFVIIVLVDVGEWIRRLEREVVVLDVFYVLNAYACFMLMLCNLCPLDSYNLTHAMYPCGG